jgi:hypothetical protein
MLSLVPLFGEFSDVIWATMAAYLMTRMYKGTAGKVGGGNFYRGNCSFTDFIPFTLMWFYHYVIKKES